MHTPLLCSMLRATSVAASILILGACASAGSGIQTESAVDPKANLQGYQSYAWSDSVAVLQDENLQWTPPGFDVAEELRFLIDEQLRGKGLTFGDAEPDLMVAYALVLDMDAQEAELRERYGEDVDLGNLHEGGLLVALVDSETLSVVWVGAAMAQIKAERTDEEARTRLKAAVAKLFEGFKR